METIGFIDINKDKNAIGQVTLKIYRGTINPLQLTLINSIMCMDDLDAEHEFYHRHFDGYIHPRWLPFDPNLSHLHHALFP